MEQGKITIVNISIPELKELIQNVISEELERISKCLDTDSIGPEYLSKKDAADKLNISLPTLTKYVKQGRIPAYRIGGKILFKLSELNQSLMLVQKLNFK